MSCQAIARLNENGDGVNRAIIGLQWGDEGKGKIIDILSKDNDIIVRFQGGNNAGHTVVKDGIKYAFHLIPSGILREDKLCVLGNGMVIDPVAFVKEMEALQSQGIEITPERLKISHNAHIIFPYHRKLDGFRESLRKNRIGTTGRGIGPCYMDKVSRCGIRAVDLLNESVLKSKLMDNIEEKNRIYKNVFGYEGFSFEEIFKEYSDYADKIKDFITDTVSLLNNAWKEGKSILFEGAQGVMLDVDFGTYPFVTSSNASVAGILSGTGISPKALGEVIGVCKAYTTRVGEGPFPTELEGDIGEGLRDKGKEFGTTTGRPRRCGWFDAVLVKYAVMVNGVDKVVITKLDVLDSLDEIKVCVGYEYNGERLDSFPFDIDAFSNVRPIYKTFKGWEKDTSNIRNKSALPEEAVNYINALSDLIGAEIMMASVGSAREAVISF